MNITDLPVGTVVRVNKIMEKSSWSNSGLDGLTYTVTIREDQQLRLIPTNNSDKETVINLGWDPDFGFFFLCEDFTVISSPDDTLMDELRISEIF